MYKICYFHIRCFLFSTSYLSSERDPGIVKFLSHILKSIFHQKLVKVVSSDKRHLYIWYTFSSCLMISDSNLTKKIVCLSIIFL